MRSYRMVPFEPAHIPAAIELLETAYQQEQGSNPLLPGMSLALQTRIEQALQRALHYPCVGICSGGQLLGYMCICAQFDFKGQQAAIVREYAHASVPKDKEFLYQHLYAALGEELVSRGIHLHAVCHLAGDEVLRDALFQLGFGALIEEQLRDLEEVPNPAAVEVVREGNFEEITELAREHARYYRDSPIFLIKDDSPAAIREALAQHRQDGDALWVYLENGEPAAYFIVGPFTGEEEGFLLQGTSTGQIKSAYAKPEVRGRGIGKALLQHSVQWAKEQGYDRLLVENETANLYGGNFWRNHFSPYLYGSIRYVDSKL